MLKKLLLSFVFFSSLVSFLLANTTNLEESQNIPEANIEDINKPTLQETPIEEKIDAERIIKSITNPLELKKTIDIIDNKFNKESNTVVVNKTSDSGFFSNIYIFLNEYFITDFYIFKNSLKDLNPLDLIKLLKWFWWICFLIPLSLLIESIISFFTTRKLVYDFSKFNNNNKDIIKDVTMFVVYLLKRASPIIITNIAIIGFFVFFVHFPYYKKQIFDLLVVFFFLRIISILIDIIFYNLEGKNFKSIVFWSKALTPILIVFLIINYALNQKEFYNSFLIKINLFIFLFMFIISLLKIRSLITNIFFDIRQHKINSIFIEKKRYYAGIFLLLSFILLITLLIIDYKVSDDIYLKVLISVISIIFLYIVQLYLYNIFHKKVIQQIKNKLFILQENYIEIKNSTHYFNLENVWAYFNFIYKYLFLLISLLVVYEVCFGNVLKLILDILSNFVILFVIQLLFLIFILYVISLILFTYMINKLIKLDSIGDILSIKKLISSYILCYKPYKIALYIISIIFILVFLGVSITALLASTSIITFFVAFGAKDILQNFFNAVLFLLEGSFFINDTVEIAGKTGVVENISLIYVKIRDVEGKLHMIPFSKIDVISNTTKDYSYCVVDIGLEYDVDLKTTKICLEEIAENIKQNPKYKDFILDNLEIVGITSLNDFSVNLRCKIKTIAGKHNFVRFGFLELIKDEFPKKGINIPYPIQTIHLQNKP
jgi:small-conductance mechanosensitive channel